MLIMMREVLGHIWESRLCKVFGVKALKEAHERVILIKIKLVYGYTATRSNFINDQFPLSSQCDVVDRVACYGPGEQGLNTHLAMEIHFWGVNVELLKPLFLISLMLTPY